MPRFALPTCPDCHGTGETERWTFDDRSTKIIGRGVEVPSAQTLAAITFSLCPCTYRPVAEEEDWTRP